MPETKSKPNKGKKKPAKKKKVASSKPTQKVERLPDYVFGRPPKYKGKETILQVLDYLEQCEDSFKEIVVGKEIDKKGKEKVLTKRLYNVQLPTVEGLALYLDVNKDTIYDWSEKYEHFSDALSKLKALQKEKIISGSISGNYNPLISKLMLSSNHGMNEKTEVDNTHTVRQLKDLTDEELEQELERLESNN